MSAFEEQLKQAMARREPAADFTSCVLARVAQKQSRRGEIKGWRWFPRRWAWGLTAATAALLAVSGSAIYQRHERVVRGEAAKNEVLTAVRIAGVKLHQVRRHVLDVEAEEVDQ
jgi:hypothetical protein